MLSIAENEVILRKMGGPKMSEMLMQQIDFSMVHSLARKCGFVEIDVNRILMPAMSQCTNQHFPELMQTLYYALIDPTPDCAK